MATDMTAEQAEQYVKEHWEDGFYGAAHDEEGDWLVFLPAVDKVFRSWLAAAEYIREHEQKIAEKREEIGLIHEYIETSKSIDSIEGLPASDHTAVFERVVAMLEAQLAELLRGWRQS